jgi:MFS family permease
MKSSLKNLLEVLSNPNARRLFAAQSISDFGTWFYFVALTGYLYDAYGSWAIGIYVSLTYIPTLLFTPWAGVVADKFSKKFIMIGCNLIRVMAMFAFFLFVIGVIEQAILLIGIIAISSCVSTLFRPARMALLPHLVGKDLRISLNALDGTVSTLALLLAPILGGLVIHFLDRSSVFLINAALILAATFMILQLKDFQDPHKERKKSHWARDMLDGLAFWIRSPGMVSSTLVYTVSHIGVGSSFVFLAHTSQVTLNWGPEGYGYLMAVIGGGSIVGMFLAGVFRWASPKTLGVVWIALFSCSIGLFGYMGIWPLVCLFLLLMGLFSNLAEPPLWTYFQNETKQTLEGRVFSLIDAISVSGLIIGSSLTGFLMDRLSLSKTTTVISVMMLIMIAVSIFVEKILSRFEFKKLAI